MGLLAHSSWFRKQPHTLLSPSLFVKFFFFCMKLGNQQYSQVLKESFCPKKFGHINRNKKKHILQVFWFLCYVNYYVDGEQDRIKTGINGKHTE